VFATRTPPRHSTSRLGLLLDLAGTGEGRTDAIDEPLVNLGKVGGVATSLRNLGPEVHQLLIGKNLGKELDVVQLGVGPVIDELVVHLLVRVVRNLLDQCENLLGGSLTKSLFVLLHVVENVGSTQDCVVVLHKVGESNRGSDTDITHNDRVEAFGTRRTSEIGRIHTGALESGRQSRPRTLGRSDRTRLDSLGRTEVLRVLADEVDDDIIETFTAGPVNPVLDSRNQVVSDEPVEEGRVHLVDIVLGAVVDGSEHEGVGVETHTLHLTIEDKLEGRVLHTRSGAVDFVEEEDARLGASSVEPVRRSEGSDTGLANPLVVRHTDEIAFGEEGETDVEQLHPGGLGNLRRNSALADAVRTAKKNSVLQVGENLEQSAESDGVAIGRHFFFLLVFAPTPCW